MSNKEKTNIKNKIKKNINVSRNMKPTDALEFLQEKLKIRLGHKSSPESIEYTRRLRQEINIIKSCGSSEAKKSERKKKEELKIRSYKKKKRPKQDPYNWKQRQRQGRANRTKNPKKTSMVEHILKNAQSRENKLCEYGERANQHKITEKMIGSFGKNPFSIAAGNEDKPVELFLQGYNHAQHQINGPTLHQEQRNSVVRLDSSPASSKQRRTVRPPTQI